MKTRVMPQHPSKPDEAAQNRPTQLVTRRIRRNAVKELRRRCKGWGRDAIVIKYDSRGVARPVLERSASISEVIRDMQRDPHSLKRFADRKDVNDPEIKLWLLAEGNPV